MFFFKKKKEVPIETKTFRDEWGRLRSIVIVQPTPRVSDKELARLLECDQATVERYRRD